ncbi:MAG TPA: hypothetical protein HA349_05370 [Methanotrichaceae archaeon]|nr:hypothetical protein [Methanotrichaceae archaeon]
MEPDTSSDQRPVIQASEILAKIERGEDVEYDGVIVEGDLDLSGLNLRTEHVDRTEYEKQIQLPNKMKVINSKITITNSEIRGNVNFGNARFRKSIHSEGSRFGGYAYFRGAQFGGYAHFKEAEFSKYANFHGAKFSGGFAHFKGAKFSGGSADFRGALFGRYANFEEAEFSMYANFQGVNFIGGDVNFLKAKFYEDADFKGAEFGMNAYFRGAEFGMNVHFREAKFAKDADFWDAKFAGDADFEKAEFGMNAYFDHDQFYRYISFNDTKFVQPVSQEIACRIAKRKMEEKGDKNAADYYFYREMEAMRIRNGTRGREKLTWPWKMQVSEWLKLVGSKIWRLGRYDLFEYVVIQGIFGYGVHPLRLFVFWILMAVAFASFYWYFDAVEGARTSVDYIWFSIATSATPGYALYNPIGHYKIVTGIQAIIGTFMWAAFIATFARKWQR